MEKLVFFIYTFVYLFVLSFHSLANDLNIDSYFQSHMVLQQNQPIVVWGKATQGTVIEANFDGEKISTETNEKGEWKLTFRPRKASFVPKSLNINHILLTDILIGEVWICAGQSNMAWPVSKCDDNTRNIAIAKDLCNGIRILNCTGVRGVAKNGYTQAELERCNTEHFFDYQWNIATEKRLQSFSAVGTHFGLVLSGKLKVPLGIICCAVGGSAINNWIPQNILKKSALTSHWFSSDWLKNEEVFINHRKRCKEAFKNVLPFNGEMKLGIFPYRFICEPSFIYEAFLARIGNVKVKGVVWYQGESDAYNEDAVKRYEELFRLMARSWRDNFKNSQLPFFIIQLPSFNSEYWVNMRNIQNRIVRKLPYTYMVPTIDLGDRNNIHYTGKREVGERTAFAVLNKVYGICYKSFPRLDYYQKVDDGIVFTLSGVGNGLKFSREEPVELELLDEKGVVSFGQMSIMDSNNIKVKIADSVKRIRYAWKSDLKTSSLLQSSTGIPLSPFEVILPQLPVFSNNETYEYGKILSTLVDRSFDSWDFSAPEFMDKNRVQAHTRANLNFKEEDEVKFYSLSEDLNSLGVHVLTRHIKSADEGAWWPSMLDTVVNGVSSKNNIARMIIDSAHYHKQKIIAYHRHMEDAYWAKIHPDWVCKHPDGRDILLREDTPRKKLCFNSPYADAFLVRAKELVRLGVDGFYFDEIHQPKTGCWCKYCKKKFEQETGLTMPEADSSLSYPALMEYKNVIIERLFRRYISELKQLNPDLAIIVGSNSWPAMVEDHTTGNLYRIVDSQKTEYSLASRMIRNKSMKFACPVTYQSLSVTRKMFHGWLLARDAANGRPSHIWIPKLKTEEEALYATYATISHGCIANLDQKEAAIPNRLFKKAFGEGNKLSKVMAHTIPMKYVALHYPESARFLFDTKEEVWKKLLYPHYQSYVLLGEQHIPCSIITDSQLEDGLTEGYKILIVPNRKCLSQKMRESVEEFELLGGVVLDVSDFNCDNEKIDQVINRISVVLEQKPSGFKLHGLDKDVQVNYFKKKDENSYVINCLGNGLNLTVPGTKPGMLLIDTDFFEIEPFVYNALTGETLSIKKEGRYWCIQMPLFEDILSIIVTTDK